MRKPSSGSVGAFFAALAVGVVIAAYGHQLWSDGSGAALYLLVAGYSLIAVSIVVMLWEHLVRRPTWPTIQWPITWHSTAAVSGSLSGPTGEVTPTLIPQAGRIAELEVAIEQLKADLEQSQAEHAEVNSLFQEKRADLERVLSDNQRLGQRAVELAKEAGALQGTLEGAEEAHLRKVDELEAQIAELQRGPALPPPPPPPDKEQLILFRARGLPMFDAMSLMLQHAQIELSDDVDGFGLPLATLLKEHVIEAAKANRERAVESGNGNGTLTFPESLRRFLLDYDDIVVWFGRLYYRTERVLKRPKDLYDWAALQVKFEDRFEELLEVDQDLKQQTANILPQMRSARSQLLARAEWWASQPAPDKKASSN